MCCNYNNRNNNNFAKEQLKLLIITLQHLLAVADEEPAWMPRKLLKELRNACPEGGAQLK
jgi:hypothetical protein